MLWKRVITASIAAPLLIIALLSSYTPIVVFLFVICVALSVFEIAAMLLPRLELIFAGLSPDTPLKVRLRDTDAYIMMALGILAFLGFVLLRERLAHGLIVTFLMASIFVGVFLEEDIDAAMGHALGYLLSIVYGVMPWLIMWDLSQRGEQSQYLILLLAIVWGGDTAAYFGGKWMGKHLLAPRISPKKTWEGAICGVLASALAAYGLNSVWTFHDGSAYSLLLASALVGIAGQFGDLVESLFKRFSRIKDSGTIFPGHGGFLDRVDGLMFGSVALWAVMEFLGI